MVGKSLVRQLRTEGLLQEDLPECQEKCAAYHCLHTVLCQRQEAAAPATEASDPPTTETCAAAASSSSEATEITA
jgi:hypothetical protein